MIAAENLGVRFGTAWVFRHLEVHLQPGDCLIVRGPNGSGKSTFLRVVAGLLSPSEGDLHIDGRVGYSAVDLQLYSALTAKQHLQFLSSALGSPLDASASLQAVGLGNVGDKLVGTYSTGMRARLKLAMATAACPDWLVLDEPTATLDDTGRELIQDVVRRQRERGGVLLATNDARDYVMATHEISFHH